MHFAAVEMAESLVKRTWIAMWMMAGMLPAAPRYIGMITADGRLWVDSAGVSNHATIFEGSVVATEETPAKLLVGRASGWTLRHAQMYSRITCFCRRAAHNSRPAQTSESKPGHCVSPWPRTNLAPSSACRIPALYRLGR